ncbi:MAG: AzlD domain-containing protein [Haloarculaceae archaeon]
MTTGQVANVWLLIVGVSLVTFGLRASFLLGIEGIDGLPPTLERVMPFVPTAVLAALVAPNVFLGGGAVAVGPGNARLVAGLLAFGVAWYTENMLATVGTGMAVLWLLLWV